MLATSNLGAGRGDASAVNAPALAPVTASDFAVDVFWLEATAAASSTTALIRMKKLRISPPSGDEKRYCIARRTNVTNLDPAVGETLFILKTSQHCFCN